MGFGARPRHRQERCVSGRRPWHNASGPAYLAAALAIANNWFTTNRTAFAGDQLTAHFQGQNYAAQLEGGYRFAVPRRNVIGVTPYAAIQAQYFQTPSYAETDLTGGGFGLSYDAMNGTDTRSEVGTRFDDLTLHEPAADAARASSRGRTIGRAIRRSTPG